MLGKKTGFEHIRSKVQAILCSPQRWQLTCLSSVAQVLSHRTPRVLILVQSLTVLLASRPTLGHAKYTHSSQVSLMSGAPSCIRFFPKMCPKFGKKVSEIRCRKCVRNLIRFFPDYFKYRKFVARILAQILARGCQNSLIDLYIRPRLPETRTWKHMHVLSPKVAQTKSANYFTTVVIN